MCVLSLDAIRRLFGTINSRAEVCPSILGVFFDFDAGRATRHTDVRYFAFGLFEHSA